MELYINRSDTTLFLICSILLVVSGGCLLKLYAVLRRGKQYLVELAYRDPLTNSEINWRLSWPRRRNERLPWWPLI